MIALHKNVVIATLLLGSVSSIAACSDSHNVGTTKNTTTSMKTVAKVVKPTTKSSPTTTVIPKGAKTVSLTFDDGPSIYSMRIKNILDKYNIKANFFNIGINAERFPQIEKSLVQDGMGVENHSYKHNDYRMFSTLQIKSDIAKTNNIITKNTGVRPTCIRPPYGSVNSRVYKAISDEKLKTMLWTGDSEDWSRPGVQKIVHNALLNVHSGSVILFHDGGGDREETIAALPIVINWLKDHNYYFVKACN